MRCYRKILRFTYKDHVTNEKVHAKIQQATGPHEDLTIVNRCKLQWYGHVSRLSGLAKTILQGTVKGGRRQGRQRKRWEDNIREWTGLEFAKSQRAVENRERWRKVVAKSSVVPQRPSLLRDRWWRKDLVTTISENESKCPGHCRDRKCVIYTRDQSMYWTMILLWNGLNEKWPKSTTLNFRRWLMLWPRNMAEVLTVVWRVTSSKCNHLAKFDIDHIYSL